MKHWVDTYTRLMVRTKLLSLLGTILVLLLVLLEAVSLADAARFAGPLNADLRALVIKESGFLFFLFAVLIVRAVIIVRLHADRYSMAFISSFILILVFGGYAGFDVYGLMSDCAPANDGNCYSTSDATGSTSFLLLAAVAYLLFSCIRFLITASVAYSKARSSFR